MRTNSLLKVVDLDSLGFKPTEPIGKSALLPFQPGPFPPLQSKVL